ncbi:uncharacterized protein LOC129352149 isoform X4 [Poeciliopsis prolifica]|uniref:uncharacterized protein LOC129352149 isoform X4 n=1 Tax=Poeciliopsis prolifica TaxID=188132 RepID=UPI002413FC40|nr:uncharacterized protein LOC129352149 isoform X4 [Poeciliopsis prolifica]
MLETSGRLAADTCHEGLVRQTLEAQVRNSFELQDSETEKRPSALIRVVKLEEVKENPMIGEIQKDEREFRPGGGPAEPVSSSEGQQGELQSRPDLYGSAPRTCDHVRDGRGDGGEALGPSASRLSTQLHYVTQSDERNAMASRFNINSVPSDYP